MNSLKIDPELKNLIPPLTEDEFLKLKENIITDGCREPLVVWDGTIVDGHNRYKICTENNIPFDTVSKDFSNRSGAIEWMLRNQLGRRNLNDFQRNEVALKYEKIIAGQMRERQRLAGGDKVSKKVRTAVDQMNHSAQDKTTRRKELAKIAGTSEGSVQRSKFILEKGTPEQIERARKGGQGNSVSAIAKEIKDADKPETKICSKCGKELPLSMFYEGKGKCKPCFNQSKSHYTDAKGNPIKSSGKYDMYKEEDVLKGLYDDGQEIVTTIDDVVEIFNVNFNTYLKSLEDILQEDVDVIMIPENNKIIVAALSEAVTAMNKLKGKYSYEK